jgi:hypothetical protein
VLSLPRYKFVAIPIPDTLSGCITGGKKFHKTYLVSLQLFTLTYVFSGPKLPMSLYMHAMVQLGNRQAIIGGFGNNNFQDKIHLFSCTNRICSIYQLDQELSLPRVRFVAIPIPDTLSGCITGGKTFHKIYHINLQLKT